MYPRMLWGPAAFALLLALAPMQVPAQGTAGPFAAMAGNWSGGGTLTMANGMQERLRCRADYAPTAGGNNLRLNIRCASEGYRFELASNVENRGGRISGEWSEVSRNAHGDLSGRVNGNRIEAMARSDMFTANLSLTTAGKRQTVAIVPQGTEVRRVSLALSKR